LQRHTVIARHRNHHRSSNARARLTSDARQLNRDFLQPAQAALRLGELILSVTCGLHRSLVKRIDPTNRFS